MTYGKESGSGLGLYHARTTVESWGGFLKIDSTQDVGTRVDIQLPLARAPTWFVERLTIIANSKVIVLDDDVSIHRIWEDRLNQANAENAGVKLLHFSTPDHLLAWTSENRKELTNTVFLIDHELRGFDQVCLSIIQDLGIQSQSILVTSHFEETTIRARCQNLGVPLIPKCMAGFVPITVEQSVYKQ